MHRAVAILALTTMVVTASPTPARAQEMAIAGTVLDRRGDLPLRDAIVRVEGTSAATRTDARGSFRLFVRSRDVNLQVTRLGFVPLTFRARAGHLDLRIRLDAKPIDLDAVVVTGQPLATEVRALGNAVGRIAVSEVVRRAPPPRLQDVLSTNVAGVRVMSTSGEVGVGGTTRIRGAGSLTLSNEPLIYVDGVRIDNSNAASGAAYGRGLGYFGHRIGYQWDVPSRVNDLDPEQIESIEIIKGPAAAALYGTEAANGVIQIITKRGHVGNAVWDTRVSAGANWLPNPEGRWSPAWFVNSAGELQEFNLLRYNRALGYLDAFRTGTTGGVGAALSGGTDAVRYFVAGDLNRDEGIVRFNWQNKFNGRGNLTYSRGRVQVEASAGGMRSRTRTAAGAFPFTSGIVSACVFVNCRALPAERPDDPTFNRGWWGRRTPDAYEAVRAFDDIDRMIGGVKVSQQLLSWLRHRAQIGADIGTNLSENLFPRDSTSPFGCCNSGYRAVSTLRSTYYTMEYSAAAAWSLRAKLVSQLSGAVQYHEKVHHYVSALGRQFALPGESDITGALIRQSNEDYAANRTLGVYLQEQLSWKNRVFLTAALRGDDNSAFGADYQFVTYPKFSAAWVLNEEPSFADRAGWIETLKLRAAYGRAGQQPDAYAAVRQYRPVTGYSGQGGITPLAVGNPNLKPEVSREAEVGFDAAFWRGRASLDFTYYSKATDDVILAAPLRPSSGFPGSRLLNSGQTRNAGVELVVGGTPLTTGSLALSVRGTLATNDSRVTRLLPGVTNMYVGEFVRQYNVIGYAPYSYFYKRVVGSNILTESNPSKWRVNCEGGAAFTSGDGTSVPCDRANLLYHGRPTPRWSGSLSAELTMFRGLHLFALVDMVGGNSIATGDVFFAHELDYISRRAAATKAIMDSVRRHGTLPTAGNLMASADPRLAGMILLVEQGDDGVHQSSGVLRNGFARLRTVSLAYSFSRSLGRRLGVTSGSLALSAHNVAMLWREQKGSFGHNLVDPEIGQNNNQTGLALYHQERWPQSTRASVVLRLAY